MKQSANTRSMPPAVQPCRSSSFLASLKEVQPFCHLASVYIKREILRALEDLKEQERTMYELDSRKDHVMTVLKVALANLAMWTRDHYFPAFYAQATWRRLVPFFQLPGTITQDATHVQVEFRPFNDRVLKRDLTVLCERVNQASPCLPDGRRLSFTMQPTRCILAAQARAKIP